MSTWAARRFWTDVAVVEQDGAFRIDLDTRSVRTPQKAMLAVPTRAFAEAIADEWRAQDKTVDPASMPMTRAANSAIDKIGAQRAEVIEMLAAYGGSDLLCYRADSPQTLIDRQQAGWTPWLDWAADRYGARLHVTSGIVPIAQHPDDLARLAAPLTEMTDFQIVAIHDLITISGSLVLGLAVSTGDLAPETAWDLARIDEEWQIEQWGRDEEADQMAQNKRAEFIRAMNIFKLVSR